MPNATDLDAIRGSVLDRMDRHARNIRLAILGAACLEGALMVTALLRVDFSNRFESVVFILFVLTYSIIALGLMALGAHVSRVGDRVLAALDGPHAGGRSDDA